MNQINSIVAARFCFIGGGGAKLSIFFRKCVAPRRRLFIVGEVPNSANIRFDG